jgi:xanthine dehydrogenase/oxidase
MRDARAQLVSAYMPQMGVTSEGKIKGMDVELFNNGGNSLDLTSSIMDRALLHIDNGYVIPAIRAVGHCCFTNQASNTAFRGFGGPQARPARVMVSIRI